MYNKGEKDICLHQDKVFFDSCWILYHHPPHNTHVRSHSSPLPYYFRVPLFLHKCHLHFLSYDVTIDVYTSISVFFDTIQHEAH